jgi:uncharacterized protein with ParB-like and HNH nuclease domain
MSISNLLDTKTLAFNDIIGNGKIYVVPQFQRDYSWDQDNWEDLWNDILTIYEEKDSHYMGSIVLQNNGNSKFQIIDGQQRFTTLSIISLAIISKIKELAADNIDKERNEERVDLLIKDYLGQKDSVSLKYSSKLFLNENNDGFYQGRLLNFREPVNYRKLIDSDKLLWDSYQFYIKCVNELFKKLETGEKLASFLKDIIGKNLLFIQITVEDELNAYTVFETLNSRGVEFTSTDLLKNYLFSLVAKSPTDLKQVKSQWKKIIEVIGLKKFPIFLRHYLNGSLKLISKEYLFKAIKQIVKTDENVFTLLDNLEDSAYIYMALGNPNDDFWKGEKELIEAINALKLFGVTQNKPLLMVSYNKLNNINEFKKLVKSIVNISYRYNVIGKLQTNEIEKIFNRAAINVNNSKNIKVSHILVSIKDLYVTDENFKNYFDLKSFNTNNSTSKKLARYTLHKIEGQEPNGSKHNYLTDPGTIEYILPENLTEQWEKFFNEDEHIRSIYKNGNITLLESSKNNKEAADHTIDIKQPIFNTSKYAITNTISVSEWNTNAIKQRQTYLGRVALQCLESPV